MAPGSPSWGTIPPPLRKRRGAWCDVGGASSRAGDADPGDAAFDRLDLAYRALVAMVYNFAPTSGHPGGSLSAGGIMAGLLFGGMACDVGRPMRRDQDVMILAAGHKALGLYSMLALRDEAMRIARPDLLPADAGSRVRIEDLLGFRRNPCRPAPIAARLGSRALDGHPTPATPFVPIATGPSGVGLAAAVGWAIAAMDEYGPGAAPRVHAIEGEGGLTPGRASEAMAAASSTGVPNLVIHVDWNQSTIDSDACCGEAGRPGDYVQWDPAELALLHDFNVIVVPEGHDRAAIRAAQDLALGPPNDQPTCVVYRTVKGRGYGILGRRSHGAGHAFMSEGFARAVAPFAEAFGASFPDHAGGRSEEEIEETYWGHLAAFRAALERDRETAAALADRVARAGRRLAALGRTPRRGSPDLSRLWAAVRPETPGGLGLDPGARATLRGQLGACLGHLNAESRGAVVAAAADLLDSTSVSAIAAGFPPGFLRARENPGARLLSAGGICEDAMGGIVAGLSAHGAHLGVASSYAAFVAPLEHIAARVHAIGEWARRRAHGTAVNPFVIVMGHAGLKTGEDGPTHADSQALQIFAGNFPRGLCVTVVPWEPSEVWPLISAALAARPAVVAAFVTRPEEIVPDRAALGLPPAAAAAAGAYRARVADASAPGYGGAVVVMGSGAAYETYTKALPALESRGLSFDVIHVSSVDLFDLLPEPEQDRILPPDLAARAIGITDFTMPTLHRFVTSERGRRASLHPFRAGRYQGSGRADRVIEEAGLDAGSIERALEAWASRDKVGPCST